MVRKRHQCVGCGKHLSSYKCLWRHKNICKGIDNHTDSEVLHSINAKRSRVNFSDQKSGNLYDKSHNDDMTKYVWETDDEVDDENIRIHKSSRIANSKDSVEDNGV